MKRVAVQALIGLAVLAVLVWRVDLLDAVRGVSTLDWRWLLPALVLFTTSKAVHAYRWRLFLRHRPELSWRELFALFLAGNFANSVLPLRAGDLLRIEVPSRRHNIPRAELASSVVLVESLLDGVAFVVLGLAALTVTELPRALVPPLTLASALVLGLYVASVLAAHSGDAPHIARWRIWRAFPSRTRPSLTRRTSEVVAGMQALRGLGIGFVALAVSCLGWLIEVTTYWMLAQAFGLALAYPEALVLTVAANLITAVPLTPWNVGPYEVGVTEVLVLLGAERGAASAFAVGSHLLVVAWIGVTGVLALWSLGLGVRDLRLRLRGDGEAGQHEAPVPDPSRRV